MIRAATALVARRAREVDPDALLAKTEVKGGIAQKGRLPFPHNCFFENEDVTTGGGDHSFDVISAFSVTKWIHLNHGDEGLLKFFRGVYDSLKPGGRFVFEPQQWKSVWKSTSASGALLGGDDAAVLAPSSGDEPASPRHRAGAASMAWRSTRRFRTNAP